MTSHGTPRSPTDFANTLILLAPLALLVPVVIGRKALGDFVRRPQFPLIAVTAAPLLIAMAWFFPVIASGLGAHRDWDAGLFLGLTLTTGATLLLSGLSAPRIQRTLTVVLPLLTLGAGGWMAANAYEPAALRRAESLLDGPPLLPDPQRSHLHVWFGQRAMDHEEFASAGDHYDRAFALNPNPRRALSAAEAWAVSGNAASAERSLAAARARGALNAELERSAEAIERMISELRAPPDSSAGNP